MANSNIVGKGVRIWRAEGGIALFTHVGRKLFRRGGIIASVDRILGKFWKCRGGDCVEQQYGHRLKQEIANFRNVTNVHDLPAIFHYWADKFLRPKCHELDIPGVTELFVRYASAACHVDPTQTCHFASLGAGNCETEVAIVEQLLASNVRNFVLECVDVNPHMLARGCELAVVKQVAHHLRFIESDINGWDIDRGYAVVFANQSLHHFQELEVLFQKTRQAIGDEGVFVISDVIGRNGHLRWPEALEVVQSVWRSMPDRYKYNHLLRRHEQIYDNWDCSVGGFEGIRAQDILPLLIKTFHFELFFAYGNVSDIFIDRAFGHNFDAALEEDRNFIDRIGILDDELIEAGTVKPTHLIAAMRSTPCTAIKVYRHLTPEFCVRHS